MDSVLNCISYIYNFGIWIFKICGMKFWGKGKYIL
jgi:hypothetical protein